MRKGAWRICSRKKREERLMNKTNKPEPWVPWVPWIVMVFMVIAVVIQVGRTDRAETGRMEKAKDLMVAEKQAEILTGQLAALESDYEQLEMKYNTNELLHEAEIEKITTGEMPFAESIGEYEVTYYVGGYRTSSGTIPTAGRTVAADTDILPYGTEIYIEGIGWRVVEDTGSAIKGGILDVYVDSLADIPAAGRHPAEVFLKRNGIELEVK
jgi:3D (Asp-Asp-Asp) domain-containing protein